MSQVQDNCRRVLDRIHNAAVRCGRDPGSIRVIAVTKTVPSEVIREVAQCGIRDIGENRLQEALPKIEDLSEFPFTWHFIGHLQTNKARKVVEHFDWVQTVDRSDLARKLNQASEKPLPVLIEVKLHDEPGKSGIEESGIDELVEEFPDYERLQLRGLMAVPPFLEEAEAVRPYFRRLHELADRFTLPELSMGMSHDFEIAVEEGATMVRIGSAIFGERR